MKTILETDRDDNVRLVEETLTDNSKVYSVEVGSDSYYVSIDCVDKAKAVFLYVWLSDVSNVDWVK